MKTALAVALFFLAAVASAADVPDLSYGKLEVGKSGRIGTDFWTVAKIIDDNNMIVSWDLAFSTKDRLEVYKKEYVWLRQPTKGLVDGKKIKPKTLYKVADTIKHNSKTMYLLEPAGVLPPEVKKPAPVNPLWAKPDTEPHGIRKAPRKR